MLLINTEYFAPFKTVVYDINGRNKDYTEYDHKCIKWMSILLGISCAEIQKGSNILDI